MAFLTFNIALLLVPAYVLWCFVYQIVYYRLFHPLAKFPGSFWGSVTRLWIAWHVIKQDECATFRRLHDKYGETPQDSYY
jgi:hypothetical protein